MRDASARTRDHTLGTYRSSCHPDSRRLGFSVEWVARHVPSHMDRLGPGGARRLSARTSPIHSPGWCSSRACGEHLFQDSACIKGIDPFGIESAPHAVFMLFMLLAAGVWGGVWGLLGGLIGCLHQRRALLAFLMGAAPVLLAMTQLRTH